MGYNLLATSPCPVCSQWCAKNIFQEHINYNQPKSGDPPNCCQIVCANTNYSSLCQGGMCVDYAPSPLYRSDLWCGTCDDLCGGS